MPLTSNYATVRIHERGDLVAAECMLPDGRPVADLLFSRDTARTEVMRQANSYLNWGFGYNLSPDVLRDPEEEARRHLRRFQDYRQAYDRERENIREYSLAIDALTSVGVTRLVEDYRVNLEYYRSNLQSYHHEILTITRQLDAESEVMFADDGALILTPEFSERVDRATGRNSEEVATESSNSVDPFFIVAEN